MTIHEELKKGVLTLKPEGRLDTVTSPELEKLVKNRTDVQKIVFDFEKVEYISSAGIRVLIQAHKAMKDKGGAELIHVESSQVREVLEMTGYSHVLNIG